MAARNSDSKFDLLDILTSVISVAGIGLMAYLTYLKLSGAESSFCDITAGVSCSAVNQSVFSELFGIPVSILGLLFFIGILGLVLSRAAGASTYPLILLATIASLVFSLYLTYTEIFILKTICVLCESSKVLMAFIGAKIAVDLVFCAKEGRPELFANLFKPV